MGGPLFFGRGYRLIAGRAVGDFDCALGGVGWGVGVLISKGVDFYLDSNDGIEVRKQLVVGASRIAREIADSQIDAVYVEDDAWEIVDYKSGRPSATDAKKVQLQAYALAADAGAVSTATPETVDVTFAYFGVDPVEEVTDRADDVWLEDAAETLTTLLAQGAEGPFPAAPSPSCRYCDFLHHCEAGKSFLAGSS